MTRATTFLAATLVTLTAGAAAAQDCTSEADPYDLDGAGVMALYDCIEGAMLAGYTSGDDAVAAVYRGWTRTSTRPAIAGPHGERFLMTFANDLAAGQYVKYAQEGVVMPAGAVLAKESFKINKGKVVSGPLFIMTKVATGTADDTAGWVYSGVQPNGQPMKFAQSFCHDCHAAWESQDYLAYPLEEVRLPVSN